jgi:hypothetical protein
MMRKLLLILFLLILWTSSSYSDEIALKDNLLSAIPQIVSASSDKDDSGEVFDIWHRQEESKLKYRKSTTKAAFLSLILPGAGEYYAESKAKAPVFVGTDAALWIGFFGLRSYGSWLKKDYRTYAAEHAGVELNGKGDDFFEDITYYQSRDEYNQFALLYSNGSLNPYPQDEFWDWQWDEGTSRYYYRELRNKSKSAYRKSLFVAGLLVANRIVSAIDAIRVVKDYNRKKSLEISSVRIDFRVNPFSSNPHFKLTLTKSF